jgi:hypothetical protein
VVSVISAQAFNCQGEQLTTPSFTFSIDNDYLTVTPVVATTGAFIFAIAALGGTSMKPDRS